MDNRMMAPTKPLLIQMADEVQEYSKTLVELRIMLQAAVAMAPEMRVEIPANVLRDVDNGKYHMTIMNKTDGIVLMAEKESVIEVAK